MCFVQRFYQIYRVANESGVIIDEFGRDFLRGAGQVVLVDEGKPREVNFALLFVDLNQDRVVLFEVRKNHSGPVGEQVA